MAWIWKAFDGLQKYLTDLAPQPVTTFLPQPTQLNDHVYEVCKPAGRSSIEIVFFHGLQLDGSNEAYMTTWLSKDGSELWPRWIADKESLSGARVLLVSYDGFFRKTADRGLTDMYITCENLVQSLTEESAQVGRDGCPVVLVGHCIGGLVIKKLLLQANKMISLDRPDNCNEYVQCLLESVKAVFYYATPHHGSKFADIETEFWKGPLVKRITTLNKKAARCNEDFRKLRQKNGWRACGIAESLPVTLGTLKTKLIVSEGTSDTQLFVDEASTRSDVDTMYTVHADHFDVCRPNSKTNSSFSQLINVIDRVLKQNLPGHTMLFSSEVVGLADQVKRVKKALKQARRLGIVGTGGMGKSTLAKEVYNSISGDFEYTCFLSNVKNSIHRRDNMEVLEKQISESLYYKGRRKSVDWSRLKKKKIFFVLDDVEHASQVYATLDGFSDESCVLVTSRDKRFVRSMDFEVYDARLLDDVASNQLFCNHAFRGADPPGPFKDHVDRFIKKFGGLPLALEVTAKYLSTQNLGDVWADTLNKLSEAKPLDGRKDDELWSIYREIYESLSEDEKQMFLDIAVCFHGEALEVVKRAWRCCSWAHCSAVAGWKNLLDKGLVTLTHFRETDQEAREYEYIQMHEVLRDLGCSLASSREIGKESTRICSDGLGRIATWPFNKGKPHFEVKILKIAMSRWGPSNRTIYTETLSGLEKLEILWLDGVALRGPWNLLPASLEFLKLGTCLRGAEANVERPFERVRMEGSSSHKEAVCENFWEHRRLRHFEIENFEDLEPLLDTLGLDGRKQLKALPLLAQHLTESGATLWRQSYRQSGDNLTDLFFGSCVVQGVWYLRHITVGEFRIIIRPNRRDVVRFGVVVPLFPETWGEIRALGHLEISGCEKLIARPNTLGHLLGLPHVVVLKSPGFQFLPDTMGELQALERLHITDRDQLETLPSSLGPLPRLRDLVISNCPHLCRLPDSLGELPALQRLEVSDCDKLEGLPDTLGPLRGLRYVTISNCPNLSGLPNKFGELSPLEHLEISYCYKLRALPDNLIQLICRSPCKFCRTSGHWENDCLLKLESELKRHQLIDFNLFRTCSGESDQVGGSTTRQR